MMNTHRKAREGALCGADVLPSLLTTDDDKVKCKKCRLELGKLRYTSNYPEMLKQLTGSNDGLSNEDGDVSVSGSPPGQPILRG